MKLRTSILLFLVFFLIFSSTGCNKIDHQKRSQIWPPESSIVMEGGSVPSGLKAVLSDADISFDCITCNSQNRYGQHLRADSKVAAQDLMAKIAPYLKRLSASQTLNLEDELSDQLMWWMVRAVLIEGNNNNFGAIKLNGKFWRDETGRTQPLVVFRSAFTPDPERSGSCLKTLLECGQVKHVVNLYDSGNLPMADLTAAEKKTSTAMGATYCPVAETDLSGWRELSRDHPEAGPERDQAMKMVARLIKEQILMPNGEPPRGNIYIHCGGGMHRTGMVIGILQKVINHATMEDIEAEYKYHVGYKDENNTGGFEQDNLDFIRDFKPEYLL